MRQEIVRLHLEIQDSIDAALERGLPRQSVEDVLLAVAVALPTPGYGCEEPCAVSAPGSSSSPARLLPSWVTR